MVVFDGSISQVGTAMLCSMRLDTAPTGASLVPAFSAET